MKKRDKKMQLHRETVLRLNNLKLETADLANAHGGEFAAQQLGAWTSCIEPNCCGTVGTT